MIPDKIKGMMEKLEAAKYQAYIIGGAVRDIKLGLEPNDYDIFTDATCRQIKKIFPKGVVIGSKERRKKILTVTVDGVEISQFRSNGNRTKTGVSLEEHQATCDFTVNSMAMDKEGKLFLTAQNGTYDTYHRILRFVGVPLDRIKEDPLRILRGIRFWTKYKMRFHDLDVVLNNLDLLDTIPKERIRDELMKIITYPTGIENLWCDGIIYKIFPELKDVLDMKGGEFHNESVDVHMDYAFKEACKITDNVKLRLAVFLHDIGKGVTQSFGEISKCCKEKVLEIETGVKPPIQYICLDCGKVLSLDEIDKKQTHFYKHEYKGAEMMEERLKHLKFSNEDIDYITTLIKLHMYSYKDEPSKKSYVKFFNKLKTANIPIEDYIMLIYCDNQGNQAKPRIKFGDFIKGSWLYKKYQEITYSEEPMTVKDLKISGKDVIEICEINPGPRIGNILKNVFNLVIDGKLKNTRAELLNFLNEGDVE